MNEYGDENRGPGGYDDERDDYGEQRGRWFDDAVRRVQTPGMLLMIFGILSLFITVIYVALLFAAPDTVCKGQYDFMKDMQKGQQNAQPMPPYEEFVKSQQMQSGAVSILQLAGSILMFLGGSKMKQLQSYGLSLTGAIMGTIPLCTNNCCCLSLPFGIWALVVLLNGDVKLAFTKVARGGQ